MSAREIADRIEALPLPERLRLAALLIEQGRPTVAEAIVIRVVDALERAAGRRSVPGEPAPVGLDRPKGGGT